MNTNLHLNHDNIALTLIKDTDLLVVVGHAMRMPWTDILYRGQCQTWLKDHSNNNFNILHIYGNPPNKALRNFEKTDEIIRLNFSYINFIRKLYLKPIYRWLLKKQISVKATKLNSTNMPALEISIIDVNPLVIFKELAVLEWFVNRTNYSHLYSTTTSSYLRFDKLMVHLNNIERPLDFCGTILKHDNTDFISGANRLFSRKVAEQILINKNKLDLFTPEDVAISKLVSSLGYSFIDLPTKNIDTEQKLSELSSAELAKNFHYRLKSTGSLKAFNMVNATYDEKVKRNDVKLMHMLHERLGKIAD